MTRVKSASPPSSATASRQTSSARSTVRTGTPRARASSTTAPRSLTARRAGPPPSKVPDRIAAGSIAAVVKLRPVLALTAASSASGSRPAFTPSTIASQAVTIEVSPIALLTSLAVCAAPGRSPTTKRCGVSEAIAASASASAAGSADTIAARVPASAPAGPPLTGQSTSATRSPRAAATSPSAGGPSVDVSTSTPIASPSATSPATCTLASRLGRQAKTMAARSATDRADGATSAPSGTPRPSTTSNTVMGWPAAAMRLASAEPRLPRPMNPTRSTPGSLSGGLGLAQLHAGADDERLRRGDGRPELVGERGVRRAAQLALHQREPLTLGQRGEIGDDAVELLALQRRRDRVGRARERRDFERTGGAAGAEAVERAVAGDHVEPRAQGHGPVGRPEGQVRADERVLHDVLRIEPGAAQHAAGEGDERLGVAVVHLAERGLRAGAEGRHQLRVLAAVEGGPVHARHRRSARRPQRLLWGHTYAHPGVRHATQGGLTSRSATTLRRCDGRHRLTSGAARGDPRRAARAHRGGAPRRSVPRLPGRRRRPAARGARPRARPRDGGAQPRQRRRSLVGHRGEQAARRARAPRRRVDRRRRRPLAQRVLRERSARLGAPPPPRRRHPARGADRDRLSRPRGRGLPPHPRGRRHRRRPDPDARAAQRPRRARAPLRLERSRDPGHERRDRGGAVSLGRRGQGTPANPLRPLRPRGAAAEPEALGPGAAGVAGRRRQPARALRISPRRSASNAARSSWIWRHVTRTTIHPAAASRRAR